MVLISKKAALELSIGTIVVLVIAIIMLIFGIVLVRSIMCSGITVTEDLSIGVKNEIRQLFSADDYGVQCLGEGSQDVKLGTGGRRKVICIIKVDEPSQYSIKVKEVESLKGSSNAEVKRWVIDQDYKGSVKPGGDGAEASVVLLDIPRDAQTTTIKITLDAIKNNDPNTKETHISVLDVVPVGFVRTTMC